MLTVLGFLIGSALVAFGIITGKAPAEIFLNKQGLAIVIGGTIASTFVSYPLREVLRAFGSYFVIASRFGAKFGWQYRNYLR